MKEIKEMPTDQQFVAIWVFNGKLWCDTVKYSEDEEDFLIWHEELNDYIENFSLSEEAQKTVKYFVLDC